MKRFNQFFSLYGFTNLFMLYFRLIFLFCLLASLMACRPKTLTPPEVVEKLRSSTVMIRAQMPQTAISTDEGTSSGTGIVLSEDGYILTNAHVLHGASSVTVAPAGSERERTASVIGLSACDDLAVIKVDNMDGLKPADLGETSKMKVGEDVLALGYPRSNLLGVDLSVTRGIISRKDATFPGEPYENLIQTDATINHGNSGGPLVNMRGEVIGINTLSTNVEYATHVNFAISLDQALKVVEELKTGGNLLSIGMNLVYNNYPEYFNGYEGGLVVNAVDSGSPALHIGVQPADLLFELGGSTVNTQADVCQILRSQREGAPLKIKLLRRVDTELHILTGEIIIGNADKDLPDLKILKKIEITVTPTPESPVTEGSVPPASTPVPSASVSPAGDDYIRVSDRANTVTLEVPADWQEVAAAAWQTDDRTPIGVQVAASENLDRFLKSLSTPGMRFYASEQLADSDPARFLDMTATDQAKYTADCADKQRFEQQYSAYSGVYDLYTGCGPNSKSSIFFMALAPKTSQSQGFIYLIARDLDSTDTDHLINTFQVQGQLP